MALPVLAKTWQFTAIVFNPTTGGLQSAFGAALTITFIGGTTYQASGVSGMTAASVGNTIKFRNLANAGNNGEFPITAQGGTTVQFTNAAGVVEGPTVANWCERTPTVNVLAGDVTTNLAAARDLNMKWKNFMRGMVDEAQWNLGVLAPFWTVQGSSNSVAAALDGVDRLKLTTDFVWNNAGSAHSWIVLQSSKFGSGTTYLLMVYGESSTSPVVNTLFISRTAFTGGTATARPTSVDEIGFNYQGATVLGTAKNAFVSTGLAFTGRIHLICSTDGECFRQWFFQAGVLNQFSLLDRVYTPITGYNAITTQFIGLWHFEAGTATAYSGIFDTTAKLTAYLGSTNLASRLFPSAEAYTSGAAIRALNFQNEISGEYMLGPVGLVCATPTVRGRHGGLFDLWWGTPVLLDGDGYPAAPPLKQFITVGDLVLPWNQTAMLTI